MSDTNSASMDFISLFKRGMVFFGGSYEWVIDFKLEELGDLSNVYVCDMSNALFSAINPAFKPEEVLLHKKKVRTQLIISQDETLLFHAGSGLFIWKPGTCITEKAIYFYDHPTIKWTSVKCGNYAVK